MNILVTGAAGFIGSQLAYRLYQEGHILTLVDNFSYGKEDNLVFPNKDFRTEVVRADIRNGEQMTDLVKSNDIEVIFHIAGIAPLPDNQSRPGEAVEVNVAGTVNILEAARLHGSTRIIFASTNAIYENATAFPTVEDDFPSPTLIYPNTKYTAEFFCRSYAECYGIPITALRFANVYGPHIDCLRQQPPLVGYMIRELYYNRTPTFYSTGNQSRDYIFIDDLLDLALKVAQRKTTEFEVLNVSSQCAHSVHEMFKIASKIMGKDIEANFADPLSFWDKYPTLREGKRPLSSEVLLHEVNKNTLCDNTRARERYDWIPAIDMEEGLRRTIAYTTALLQKNDAA